jgi:hypothetical protein
MAKKLSTDDIEKCKKVQKRFEKIAPAFKIKLEEPRNDYVHISRDGNVIGCFTHEGDDIVFKFQHGYRGVSAHQISINVLPDEEIINAIIKTPGKPLPKKGQGDIK